MDNDKIYKDLMVGEIKTPDSQNSLDDFLSNKIKVASMSDLLDFTRIGGDTLVHKSKKDLWKIGEDEKGGIVIERLFDPATDKALQI